MQGFKISIILKNDSSSSYINKTKKFVKSNQVLMDSQHVHVWENLSTLKPKMPLVVKKDHLL